MKVIIIGVGNSGTKLLGILVNELLSQQGIWPYYYEPLFWQGIHGERGIRPSPNGLKEHTTFPLLPDNSVKAWPWMENFISRLWGLAKFIRAGSRVRLFYEKNVKLIWITRELHSYLASMQNYQMKHPQPQSGWHHRPGHFYDDYDRLAEIFPQFDLRSEENDRMAVEAAWWRLHNEEPMKYAGTDRIFHIHYEDLCDEPLLKMKEIADFLDIPFEATPSVTKIHEPPQRRLNIRPDMENRIDEIAGKLNQEIYPKMYGESSSPANQPALITSESTIQTVMPAQQTREDENMEPGASQTALRDSKMASKRDASILVNIVYAHSEAPQFALHKGQRSVLWSREPLDGCDVYAYLGAFSYCGQKSGLDVLIALEPIVVLPGEYDDNVWQHFDHVLTFVDSLAGLGKKFHKILFPVFDFPFTKTYLKTIDHSHVRPLSEKKNGICMINGNKTSRVPGELYSKRIETARWFHEYSDIPFDIYGRPPFQLPNYRGQLEPHWQKFPTLAEYRYCLCFENIYDPFWSKGYLSEKMLDCLMCGTVPIYLGCYNIEEYVPSQCFIDFRQFKKHSELDQFLTNISDSEYDKYIRQIHKWVDEGNLSRYSMHRIYDKLLTLADSTFSEKHLATGHWEPGLAPDHTKRQWQIRPISPVWSWQELASARPPERIIHRAVIEKQLSKMENKSAKPPNHRHENFTIHCIGDSHVYVFSGVDMIGGNDVLPFFKTYRLGPHTAYNAILRRSFVEQIIMNEVKKNDLIMFCFGEIDCRVHLIKQAEAQKRSLKDVISQCVERYSKLFEFAKAYSLPLLAWNVPPSCVNDVECGEYSTYGTFQQRKEATNIFNSALQEYCEKNGVTFISIYDKLFNEDGLPDPSFFMDNIHLSQNVMPLILDELQNKGFDIAAARSWNQDFPGMVRLQNGAHVPDDPYEAVIKSLQVGRNDEAEKKIRQILTKEPHHLQALNDLGVIFSLRGEKSTAFEYFLAAGQSDKTDRIVIHNLIGSFIEMGRRDDAIATLKSSLEFDTTHNLLGIGELYLGVLSGEKEIPQPLFHHSTIEKNDIRVTQKEDFHEHILTLKWIKSPRYSLTAEFLNELAQIFHSDVFVETGTFLGGTTLEASRIFKAVHTIELSEKLFRKAKTRFEGKDNIKIYQGDSGTIFPELLKKLSGKIVFWLDGHYSEGITAKSEKNTPILEELVAIKDANITDSIILIDDLRMFPNSWTRLPEQASLRDYPTIPQLLRAIKEINSAYSFVILGDVFIAYPSSKTFNVSPVIAACTISRLFEVTDEDVQKVIDAEKIIGTATGNELLAIRTLYSFVSPEMVGLAEHYRLWNGLTLLAEQQLAHASKEFQTLIANGFSHWRIHWYLARTAHQSGDFGLMRQEIKKVLGEKPDFRDAKALMADIYKQDRAAYKNNVVATSQILRMEKNCMDEKDKIFSNQEFISRQDLRSIAEKVPDSAYLRAVKESLDNYDDFRHFKRNPGYQVVLEHVTPQQGQAYLEIIRNQTPEILSRIDLIKMNDLVGSPVCHKYDSVGKISPTTLRYAKVASDLKILFGDLIDFRIVEVGCGYGGQMLIIDQLFAIKKYLMFDLPPVLDLIQKYLESHLINSCYETSTINQYDGDNEFDLVISNYAFSELPPLLQEKYVEKIFTKAKRGYLTMNTGLPDCTTKNHLNIDELKRYLPNIELFSEKPLTGAQNYIICWGHKKKTFLTEHPIKKKISCPTFREEISEISKKVNSSAFDTNHEYLATKEMEIENCSANKPCLISCVIFSKDRAMQLDCTLRSFFLHCTDPDLVQLNVLYKASSPEHENQYQSLKTAYPTMNFVPETDFKQNVLSLLSGYEYILFMVDDNIFTHSFRLEEMKDTLDRNANALGFSLRLGTNTTYFYMLDKSQTVPPFDQLGNSIIKFDWTKAELDFAYPLELSSSLYRTEDIQPLLKKIEYTNPNLLELQLETNKIIFAQEKNFLLSFEKSVAFCNPVNAVQTMWINRAGKEGSYTAQNLSDLFGQGNRINAGRFSGFVPNACHQEVAFDFVRENISGDGQKQEIRKKSPLVTIGIANYNGIQHIQKCIESVRRNTPEPHEVIVVDNGSTDGSREYLRKQSDIILVENPENVGAPGARNQFLSIAKGDYVVFLDNDTLVTKDWIRNLVTHMESDPQIGIIGACTNYASGLQGIAGVTYKSVEELEVYAETRAQDHRGELLPSPKLISFCVFIRRAAIEKIGAMETGFSKFCFEDDDYAMRIHIAGFKSVVAHDVFIHHTGGPQGRGNKQYNKWLMDAWEGFKRKWGLTPNLPYGSRYDVGALVSQPFNPKYHYLPLPDPASVLKLVYHTSRGSMLPKTEQLSLETEAQNGFDDLYKGDSSPGLKTVAPERSEERKIPVGEDITCSKIQFKKKAKSDMVSIIIPVTGHAKRLKKCIENIGKYTPETHEIIFVENGCKGGILKWIKEASKRKSNYCLIKAGKEAGQDECFNVGMEASSGEYIVLLYKHVMVADGWLGGMLRCINRADDVGIVGPMTNAKASGRQCAADSGHVKVDQLEEYARAFIERNRHRRVPSRELADFCMLFRRSLVEQIGPFDEELEQGSGCDDYCLRAALEGYKSVIAGDVFVLCEDFPPQGNKRSFAYKWKDIDAKSHDGERLGVLNAITGAEKIYQEEEVDKAILKLLDGLKYRPEEEAIYHRLTKMLIDCGRFKEGLDAINSIPEDKRDSARSLELAGYCKAGLELYDEAAQLADRALFVNPSSASALNLKGVLAHGRDDKNASEDFFKKAIAVDPGYGEAYTNLGILEWETGRKQDALEMMERGFILSPTAEDSRAAYLSAVSETAEFERAEGVFREAKAIYPGNRRIAFLLIDMLIRQEKYDSAMQDIREAMVTFGINDGILSAAQAVLDRFDAQETKDIDKKPALSLCMIVKNEENCLARCLMSAIPVVDEIIIVDTGSTDRTKAIAKTFGAKIYDFEWTDDFSEARNYSLSKVTGNWVLLLDADEVISPRDYDSLRRIVNEKSQAQKAYRIITRNYVNPPYVIGWTCNSGEYPNEETGTGWYPSRKVRLFPNKEGIYFENPVHEFVETSLSQMGIEIERSDIPVHHYGQLDREHYVAKGNRYYPLGKKKLAQKGGDLKSLIELAVQAGGEFGKYEEAVALWQKVLDIDRGNTKALLNMSGALLKLEKYEAARTAADMAMKLAPGLKEAVVLYSTCEVLIGEPDKTIPILEDLINSVPNYPLAFAILAAAYGIEGQKRKGFAQIKNLARMGFSSADYLYSIADILTTLGKKSRAISLLEFAVEIGKGTKSIRELLSVLLQK